MPAGWLPHLCFSFTAGMELIKGHVSPVTPLVWMQHPDSLFGIGGSHHISTTVSSPASWDFCQVANPTRLKSFPSRHGTGCLLPA